MARRHRILVSTSTFPRWQGDAVPARFVYDLCRELADSFDITVATPHDPGAALAETLNVLKVRRFVYFWPSSAQKLCNGVGILPNVRSSLLGKMQAPTLILSQAAFLRRLTATQRFDLVHSHWMVPGGLAVAMGRIHRRAPHVVTIHSSDLHLARQLPGGRRLVRSILARTDALFVVSTYLHKLLEELVGEPVEATVLPMGVRTARFRPDAKTSKAESAPQFPGRRVVLYVGKLIEVKGVVYLLRAFERIRRAMPEALLVVVGGGDLDEALKAEAARLSLDEHVRFLGPKPHSEVTALYREAELVAVPSIVTDRGETEGLPVVILEALASGTPVVASKVGSLEDVIESGKNGLLVEPKNPEALADGLQNLLQRPDLAAMAADAPASVERYDWSSIAAHYAETYRKLIEK